MKKIYLLLLLLIPLVLSAQFRIHGPNPDSSYAVLSKQVIDLIEINKTAKNKQYVLFDKGVESVQLEVAEGSFDKTTIENRYSAVLNSSNSILNQYNNANKYNANVFLYINEQNIEKFGKHADAAAIDKRTHYIDNIDKENNPNQANLYDEQSAINILDAKLNAVLSAAQEHSDKRILAIGVCIQQISKINENHNGAQETFTVSLSFKTLDENGEPIVINQELCQDAINEINNFSEDSITSIVNKLLKNFDGTYEGTFYEELFTLNEEVPNTEIGCQINEDPFGQYFLVDNECNKYVTPVGQIFILPKGTKIYKDLCGHDPTRRCEGALHLFQLPNKDYYFAIYADFDGLHTNKGTRFYGYYKGVRIDDKTIRFSNNNPKLEIDNSGILLSIDREGTISINERLTNGSKNVDFSKGKYISEVANCSSVCKDIPTLLSLQFENKNQIASFEEGCIDPSFLEIENAIKSVLNNPFYSDVKQCIRLRSSKYNYDKLFCSKNCDKINNDYILDIEVEGDAISTKIEVSDNYLFMYVNKIRDSAALRGIDVNVEELREQVKLDLVEAAKTNGTFFKRFIIKVSKAISGKIGDFVEGIAVSQKIAKNIWKDGTLPTSTWHSTGDDASDHTKWPVYAQLNPLVAGGADGVIDEITGIPMAVKGVYGIITDEEQQQAILGLFSKDGLAQLLQSIEDEAKEIVNDKEKGEHFSSQMAVSIAASFTGIGVITKTGKIKETLNIATETVKTGIKNSKVAKVLNDLRKRPKYFAPRHQAITDFLKGLDARVLNQLADIPGFDRAIQEMSYTWKKHHAGKFIINNIKEKGDKFIASIQSFGSKVDDALGDFTSDVAVKVGNEILHLEYKSWKRGTFSLMKGIQFKKQLKNYIKNGKFEYIFDKQKLILDNVVDPELFVKGKFKELFSADNYAMFDDFWNSPEMKQMLFTNINDENIAKSLFKGWCNNLNPKLFKNINAE